MIVKTTLLNNDKLVTSGLLPLNIGIRTNGGDGGWNSLGYGGELTNIVKGSKTFYDKIQNYDYVGRLSGDYDSTDIWVERFHRNGKDMYILFKPFKFLDANLLVFDGEKINYEIDFGYVPSKITLTDNYGSSSNISPSQKITVSIENSVKYIEAE